MKNFKARSSVTETVSCTIPDSIRKLCIDAGIGSKSLLLQISRQPGEKKMIEAIQRIAQAGLTRDEARRERQEEKNAGPRPQPFIFNFRPENESFRLRIQFRKSNVSRGELIDTLRNLLETLEQDQDSSSETQTARQTQQLPEVRSFRITNPIAIIRRGASNKWAACRALQFRCGRNL